MEVVAVSEDYMVTLPARVCQTLQIRPGQRLNTFVVDGRMVMTPVREPDQPRGFLRGIDTSVERDPDRF
ncbi:MAG TPA: AbrB/MazE/SpoVT family DNA-binding domain-containing protein [Longimicrobium sp.]|nr:AbrB/MazE/SpoVT family DNA-binding domain-containing protein [Longimicrobium sp.]